MGSESPLYPDSSGGVLPTAMSGIPQVLQNANSTTAVHLTGSFAAVGPSQAITLQKATNRVKITCQAGLQLNTGLENIGVKIYRDGVTIPAQNAGFAANSASITGSPTLQQTMTIVYIDSPGDTVSHTYQAYGINYNSGSSSGYYGITNLTTLILLEEILS